MISLAEIIYLNTCRTDYLSPLLTPPQSQIVDHIFSRSIMVGQDTCRLSYSDLARLTRTSIATTARSIVDRRAKLTHF